MNTQEQLLELIEKNDFSNIKKILEETNNLLQDDDYLVSEALVSSDLNILKSLLSYKNVDFLKELDQEDLLLESLYLDNYEAFKFLYNHEEINPHEIEEDLLFIAAMENDSIEIVDFLLKDKKLDITKSDDLIDEIISSSCDHNILKNILADKRINFEFIEKVDENIIEDVVFNQDLELLKVLLEDGRFDPSFNNNAAIQTATLNYDQEFVTLLWNDERVQDSLEDDDIELYEKLKL
jgi:hypothetical protein